MMSKTDTGHHIVLFKFEGKTIRFIEPEPIDYITEKIKTENKFYEFELLDWLRKVELPTGDFIDIGANIGNHTVYFSRILGRKTWSFEPYDRAYKILKRNLELNNISNVEAFGFGLGRKENRVRIVLPKDNNIGAAHVELDNTGNSVIKPGDEVLKVAKKVALIKIDVEGFEKDVLKGCEETIKKNRPVMLVECINKQKYEENYRILQPLGYAPRAVFGATPMVVFTTEGILPDLDSTTFLLSKYFDADARLNIVRARYKALITKSTANIEVDKLKNRLKEREGDLHDLKKRLKATEATNKRLANRCKVMVNSKSYRLGRFLTFPVRGAIRTIEKYAKR